jgi:hypothetical protein
VEEDRRDEHIMVAIEEVGGEGVVAVVEEWRRVDGRAAASGMRYRLWRQG